MQSKTKKAFRNVLAFLTVLTMMLGMLPTTLLAANTDDSGTMTSLLFCLGQGFVSLNFAG